MQGAPKRQVNAEDMLAELKRALESSTLAPDAPPRAASTAPKPNSRGPETRRSQIGGARDRPLKANAERSIGARADPQRSTRAKSGRWGLTAGGLALAGAAAVGASYAFINKAPDLPTRELSVTSTDRPKGLPTSRSSTDSLLSMEDLRQAAPAPVGAVAPRPDAVAANKSSLPPGGNAEGDAPHSGSAGSDAAAPAFAPALLNEAAIPVTTVRIGPDGSPIATPPSPPASTDSAHPAGTPKPALQTAAPQTVKPEKASVAPAPSTPASTNSAPPPAEAAKPAAPTAASQMVKPDQESVATAPSGPASTNSAPPLSEAPKPAAPTAASQMVKPDQESVAPAPPARPSTNSAPLSAQAPKPAAPTAASQMVKPDQASVAPAPPARPSTNSAPLSAQAPKPKATQTASVSNESAEPSTPKSESKKKSSEKISEKKPAKSAKASSKPIPPERQSTEPAALKEAEKSPPPAQNTGDPPAAAPAPKPSVQQRVADGVTHAFGYLVHLPGALVPHLGGGSDADAH